MKTLSGAPLLVLLSIAGAGTLAGQSGAVPTLPSPTLLVAEKRGGRLGVVDATTLQVIAYVPATPSPHEVATDQRFASAERTQHSTGRGRCVLRFAPV